MSKKIDHRLELFALYYMGEARWNATEASIMAGYKAKNRHAQNTLASQLVNRPEVQKIIAEKVEEVGMTQSEIITEMVKLAKWDWTDKQNLPDLTGLTAGAHAKNYDTLMRAKLTALSALLKLQTNGIKDQMEKLKAAFQQHKQQYPEMSDEDRAEKFKEHIEPSLVEEMLRELMKSAENRKRLTESEAVIEEPMLEEV